MRESVYKEPSQGQIEGQKILTQYLADLFGTTPESIRADLIEFGVIYLIALGDKRVRHEFLHPPAIVKRAAEIMRDRAIQARKHHVHHTDDTVSETLARAIPRGDDKI